MPHGLERGALISAMITDERKAGDTGVIYQLHAPEPPLTWGLVPEHEFLQFKQNSSINTQYR